jgi:hypothetical protein
MSAAMVFRAPGRQRPFASWGPRTLAVLAVTALGGWSCGGDRAVAGPSTPTDDVTRLEVVGGGGQTILAGRRSPEPVRVLATDAAGEPVPGAVVDFSLAGAPSILSQPRALTDEAGVAETFLLEPASGTTVLSAVSGQGRTALELLVLRAPGELRVAPGSGEAGLPGMPHPDSLVRVQVLDTEDRPMEGIEVWFAGHSLLAPHRDTTDADGWAATVVRKAGMQEGDGPVFAFVLGFPELTVSAKRPLVAAARDIVLVSIDGLRGDALERYELPTLSRLAREGASTGTARSIVPSLTTPAHLSLFSGVGPETHGTWSEDLTFTAEMAELEPLFREAGRGGLGAEAFVAAEGPLAGFEIALRCRLAFGFDSLTLVERPWSGIPERVRPALTDEDVRLVFVHIPDPDLAGHADGFESDAYRDAVLRADDYVARMLADIGEDALLIVTSDHGGGGAYGSRQHGSDSPEDVLIPLILWGPRVQAVDLGEASILDVAPTALWALGLPVPSQYEGSILLRAFR